MAYAIVFIAFTDNFSMLPTIGPYTQHLGGNALAMGVAVAAYSASNLLFNVLGGIMLDRAGRRRLLLVGLAAASLSMAAYAGAGTVSNLLLIRLLHGAAGGILVPAVFTMIADVAPLSKRSQAMGRAGALIGSAAVIAPAVAGGLRQAAGFNAVFCVGALLLGLGFVAAAFKMPETRRPGKREEGPDGPEPQAGAVPAGSLAAPYWGIFILTFTMGTLTAFLPRTVESLGYKAGVTGLMFTAFGLMAAFVMMSPLAQTVDRRGLMLPTGWGLALAAASLTVLALAHQIGWILFACSLFGLGYGLIFPATSGQVARIARSTGRGRAFGVYYAIFSLGVIAGAPAGGLFQSDAPLVGSPYFPAFIASVAGMAVLAALVRYVPGEEGPAAAAALQDDAPAEGATDPSDAPARP